jgi:AcrR family transcriptional regulator
MTTRIQRAARRKQQTTQAIDSKRRIPIQNRAKSTIETIIEATARILEREGRSALNTNYIAERAGISVGTLYQYFRNKEEILVAIARNLFEGDSEAALKAIAKAGLDHPDPERLVVQVLINSYKDRRKTRRAAVDAVISEGLAGERMRNVETIAKAVLARSALTPTRVWVLTRAVNGVLRATMEEESPLLGTKEFEDELVRLVHSYLTDVGDSVL